MVLQVRADAGRVVDHVDAVPAKHRRRADTGQHEQLRRVDRTAAEQHFACDGLVPGASSPHVRDAAGAPALEGDSAGLRAGAHHEVASPQRGAQVGRRARAARAALLRDLVEPRAFLHRTVEIIVAWNAGLRGGVDEDMRERIDVAKVGDMQRAVAAVQRVGAPRIRFAAPEVGQHARPVPAFGAAGGPVVVVPGQAAHVAHGVDGTGAAKHAPAWPPQAAPVQLRLGLGRVIPVEVLARDQLRKTRRHVDEGMAIGRPGLEQEHAHGRIGR